MLKANLPTHVEAFARNALGAALAVYEVGDSKRPVRTWRWDGERASAYVKAYGSPRPFRQERDAYLRWAPQLPDVPALLGHVEEATRALAIEALTGTTAESSTWTPEREASLHEAAGVWLRRLHDLPSREDDPVALGDAYRMRWSVVGENAPGLEVPTSLLRWLGETLERALQDIGGSRVPCHRDYHPANWLVGDDGAWVGVIDFEHARADHPLADAARLAAYVWPGRRDLEDAFWRGYGALPGDRHTLQAFAVAEAWHRWSWGRRHGDPELVRSGANALAALGAPVDPGDLAYPAP